MQQVFNYDVISGVTSNGNPKNILVDSNGSPIVSVVSLPTGAATSDLQTTANTSLNSINNKLPALGQALAAASTPVVLPDAQITALTPLSTIAATQSGNWNIGSITTLPSLPTGANTIGAISNTAFSITGTLPAFAATPTFNIGTAPAGLGYLSTATITRAANTTAYTANDVYGTVFELTDIGASGGFIFIDNLDIMFNISSLPVGMGAFSVYLFSSSPPSAITDNLPYSLSSGDRASAITKLGIDLTASLARGGGTVVAERIDLKREIKLATGSTSLWGYLVTLGSFTPAANSETATITVRSFAP